MLKHIRILPFSVGLIVGVLMILYYNPGKTVVYEYPHPQNVNERVYRDTNGVCYKYSSKKVECDANEGNLRPYPIQS
jgi:hypothetical protein